MTCNQSAKQFTSNQPETWERVWDRNISVSPLCVLCPSSIKSGFHDMQVKNIFVYASLSKAFPKFRPHNNLFWKWNFHETIYLGVGNNLS